jgi:hypothetical protein
MCVVEIKCNIIGSARVTALELARFGLRNNKITNRRKTIEFK